MNHPKLFPLLPVLICLAVISSCSPAAPTPVATEIVPPPPDQPGVLVVDKNDLFSTAGTCTACHQNTLDKDGNDISSSELWRGTMMANAMIDPYYQASVQNEAASYPQYADLIGNECNTCHMPMAHYSDSAKDIEGTIFGPDGYANIDNPLHNLAVDGVSCTACHQILKDNLGEQISFSGGMVYDLKTPSGMRELFGPYIPQDNSVTIMANSSGFAPIQGTHLIQADFCATCHNLYTNYVKADGTLSTDLFPEQTPYTEWLASDFANTKTCQDCHMPIAEGEVAISNLTPDTLRSPYNKHFFVGGNYFIPNIIKQFSEELKPQTDAAHFDATIALTKNQLQNQTAAVELKNLSILNNELSFDAVITNLSGHKFPTSYPSRRAWLHVTVKDTNGEVVFESGNFNSDGSIVGNDNDNDAKLFEPHYNEINNAEQVQIYESVMENTAGEVTTILLSAASYIKDNRLLPTGFDKNIVSADISPSDAAKSDENFLGGSDTVTYRIDTADAAGPFMVEVELLYQPIGFRWARNAIDFGTEGALAFAPFYDAVPNLPVLVAGSSLTSQ